MTPIDQQIYDFLREIPQGKVVSYKTIASYCGIHSRTVARILSKNTDQERYPCFRVVHTDGGVGGYNLGADEKLRRLLADGVIIHDGKVSKEYFWNPPVIIDITSQ